MPYKPYDIDPQLREWFRWAMGHYDDLNDAVEDLINKAKDAKQNVEEENEEHSRGNSLTSGRAGFI